MFVGIDDDDTIWQASVSVPDEISSPSGTTRGVDMYWGYKMVPIDNGNGTRITLLASLLHPFSCVSCQTLTFAESKA